MVGGRQSGVSMGRKYFGTDGVRGTVGGAPITPDFVMRLGYAAGTTLVAREHLRGHANGASIRPC
jgi:phosphomannomutase